MPSVCKNIVKEFGLILSFAALYCLFHYRYFFALDDWILGGAAGDAAIYLWLAQKSLQHASFDIFQFFDVGLFYPFGLSLAFTDNFILPAAISSALRAMGLSEILAYNSVILGATTLNGYCLQRLCFRVTQERIGAYFSGLLFMLSPYFFGQLGHPQLQFAFFIVLALEGAWAFIEKPKMLPALSIGWSVVGAFLCSVYYALFSILLLVVFFLCCLILRRNLVSLKILAKLATANIPAMLALLWFATPYMEVKEIFGPKRPADLAAHSLHIMSYISAPGFYPIWGFTDSYPTYEARLGNGISAMLMSFIGFITLFCSEKANSGLERFPKIFICTTVLIAVAIQAYVIENDLSFNPLDKSILLALPMWLSLSAALAFLVSRSKSTSDKFSNSDLAALIGFLILFFHFAAMGLTTPADYESTRPGLFFLLFSYVPGIDALRVPCRLGAVLLILLSLLSAIGIKTLLSRNKTIEIALTSLLVVFALAERMPIGGPIGPIKATPELFSELTEISPDEPLLGLPQHWVGDTHYFITDATEFMMQTRKLPNPIINGYSGVMPGFATHMGKVTDEFPSPRSVQYLARVVGLKHIIYRPGFQPNFNIQKFESALEENSRHLSLVKKDKQGNYLLHFHPQIHARHMTFYLNPDLENARELSLEYCFKGETRPERVHLEVKTGMIPRKDKPELWKPAKESIIIRPGKHTCWQNTKLVVPPSTNHIRAHKVSFAAHFLPQDANVFLRNVTLSSLEHS